MMNEKVQFVCPLCGETRLVEIRGNVQVKTSVVGFFVDKNPTTDSKRYSIEEGEECGRSDGKVVGYECEACGFSPKTQSRERLGVSGWTETKPKAIVNKRALYQWLKRNSMLTTSEHEVRQE